MQVRPKKSLGQHFLTDLAAARKIADSLQPDGATNENPADVLEIGPGMGVLSQYLLERDDISLKMVEIDSESVDYLLVNFPKADGALIQADFLKLDLGRFFSRDFCVIGNFPYNISSQIFFRILDYKDRIPQVVCMIQKEVAERIAEKFTVGEGAFNPPPKVKSAVIRLKRNARTTLGCDEELFRTIVKTSFNQRRKTLRNSLKPLAAAMAGRKGWDNVKLTEFLSAQVFDLRPEKLGVEDFISLTGLF